MFRHILLGFFWDCYDNLGHILLVNVIWFFCNLPSVFLFYLIVHISQGVNLLWILLLIPVFIFSVTTVGMFAYTKLLMEAKDNAIKQYFIAIKQYFWQGTVIVLIHLILFALIIININYYLQLRGGLKMVGAVLAGLAFWFGMLVLLESLYPLAVLVQQNLSIGKTLKRSVLLVLDNLLVSIGVFLFLVMLMVLSILSGVGPILFIMSLIAMLGNNAIYEIMSKYQKKVESESALAPGEKPTSWKQIREQEKADQQPKWRHDNRGWKDIFRPWEL